MSKKKNDAPTVADQSASSMIANNSSLNTIAQTSLQNQGSSNKDNIELDCKTNFGLATHEDCPAGLTSGLPCFV